MLHLVNTLREMALGQPPPAPAPTGSYLPTAFDICKVRALLGREKRLPPDIVDLIFDHAEYWAHSSNSIDYMEEHKDALRIAGGGRMENRFLVSSQTHTVSQDLANNRRFGRCLSGFHR